MSNWRITQDEYIEIIKIILSENYDKTFLSSKAKHHKFDVLRENRYVAELLLKILEYSKIYRKSKPNNKTYTYNVLLSFIDQYETLIVLMGLQNEEILNINKRALWLD